MEREKRNCLHCGKPIQGRLDKKFCDDSCRNTYNNQQNSENVNLVRRINYILKKNRNILHDLIPSGEDLTKIPKDKLTRNGFDFSFFTHVYKNKKGNFYHYCYDFGYLELDGEWFLIVKGKS